MKRTILLLLVFLNSLKIISQNGVWTSVADHNADPAGKVKCTHIINRLIDSLSSLGGGTVYFPAGTFLTGSIEMKSNITLYLDAGAVLRFSDDFNDYLPMVPSRWEDVRVMNFRSQIYAYRCNNISIKGEGHLEGQGAKWWDFMRKVNAGQPVDTKWQDIFKGENASLLAKNAYIRGKNNFLRPPMITTYECSDILIEGVSFSNPPFWTIMPAFSDNITITGITIRNPGNSPNTDGIDPSSCRNVHISNCHITVGDDCIVIKSGRDEDGREAGRPTENITITNCTMLEGHGGVVIGSEMSGNVKRISISNCIFEGTDIGIRIKTMRGRGGLVEDVRVSNINMYNIVNEGVLITLRYQPSNPEPLSERTPAVRNIHLSNINIRDAQRPAAIYGLEEQAVSQVSFNDIRSISKNGILLENTGTISFHDIEMAVGNGPALEIKDSEGISWDRVTVIDPPEDDPLVSLTRSKNIRITNCYQPERKTGYISKDVKSTGVYFMNNILPGIPLVKDGDIRTIISKNNITE